MIVAVVVAVVVVAPSTKISANATPPRRIAPPCVKLSDFSSPLVALPLRCPHRVRAQAPPRVARCGGGGAAQVGSTPLPSLSASKMGRRASSSTRSPVTKRLAAGASCGSTALVMAARRRRMAMDRERCHLSLYIYREREREMPSPNAPPLVAPAAHGEPELGIWLRCWSPTACGAARPWPSLCRAGSA